MKKQNYRHGDVVLVRIDAIPNEARTVETRVLAEGEATGHAHRLSAGQVCKWDEKMYVSIQDELATLSHEEHHEIKLPAGDYAVIIQRQYDDEKEWAKVID